MATAIINRSIRNGKKTETLEKWPKLTEVNKITLKTITKRHAGTRSETENLRNYRKAIREIAGKINNTYKYIQNALIARNNFSQFEKRQEPYFITKNNFELNRIRKIFKKKSILGGLWGFYDGLKWWLTRHCCLQWKAKSLSTPGRHTDIRRLTVLNSLHGIRGASRNFCLNLFGHFIDGHENYGDVQGEDAGVDEARD